MKSCGLHGRGGASPERGRPDGRFRCLGIFAGLRFRPVFGPVDAHSFGNDRADAGFGLEETFRLQTPVSGRDRHASDAEEPRQVAACGKLVARKEAFPDSLPHGAVELFVEGNGRGGVERDVELVPYEGSRIVIGFRGEVMGLLEKKQC